jgi:carbon storage regulator
MLCLCRKKDELIYIGDDIRIAVIKIYSNYVSLGIDAPQDCKIWRKEIYDKIKSGEIRNTEIMLELKEKINPENIALWG